MREMNYLKNKEISMIHKLQLMKSFRSFFYFVIVFYLISVNIGIALANQSNQDVEKKLITEFSEHLTEKIMNTLESKDSDKVKLKILHRFFDESIDINWIARFVLGQYYKKIDKERLLSYESVYREYTTCSCLRKFYQYNKGQKSKLLGLKKLNQSWIIKTHVTSSNFSNKNIEVLYKIILKNNSEVKIIDIIVEGVSMIYTQRSDFSSLIASDGIDGLITALEKKSNACLLVMKYKED